ncbi:MAG: carbon-nitrogen hydrolase family protein [Pseudomonadota bacterium]
MPKIAVLQMTSGIDPEANFRVIEKATKEAKANGAQILFTPEMSLLLDRNRKRAAKWIASPKSEEMYTRLYDLAGRVEMDLAIGSMPMLAVWNEPEGKWVNRSFYFTRDQDGPTIYDKMHMFDVDLASGESWRESNAYHAGKIAVTDSHNPLGTLGLTICYDLRFPALFEALGRAKCDAIAVPAAFTKPTGAAHWHVLLRARAIEASAFVIAAAQVGKHEDGRETYGHSLVVDPWGEVLLDMGGEEPGLGFCDIDLNRIEEVRSQIPSLANKRDIPKYEAS